MRVMNRPLTSQNIKTYMLECGFDVAGITHPHAIKQAAPDLRAYLQQGRHGSMNWMEDRAEWRSDPARLWPEARSIIVTGMNYGPEASPLGLLSEKSSGALSVYAQGRDYHDVIKKKLKSAARWIVQETGAQVKVFVDTAPVMEKPLAAAAGLGWQGKHTNLVSQSYGSWLFLGSIFTTLSLEPDESLGDHCGTCQDCLEICPTQAFTAPHEIDARRCISYLTIEYKGHIPIEFRRAIGNRIYGCDDCLAVCPWNKFAQSAQETAFHARSELHAPLLEELAHLDDAAFRKFFSRTPIKRIGRDRFIRNVLIAIGNSKNPLLLPCALNLISDPAPIVRAMAIWAVSQLDSKNNFTTLKIRHENQETDKEVRQEWEAGSLH